MFLIKVAKKIFHFIFATSDVRVSIYLKAILFFKEKKLPRLGLIVSRKLQRNYGVFISYSTVFDETLELKHPCGIIIGEGVSIGKNVKIFQNVTLGRGDTKIIKYPKIGSNVTIYAGAVVLGDIKVGENSVIGANAVVIKDIPPNSIAVGVPAKIINK